MTDRSAAMHLRRPQLWGWLFAAPFVATFVWFAQHGRIAASGMSVAAALAWLAIATVRPADRHRVRRVAIVGAVLTLVTTWFSAAVVAYAVTSDRITDAWVTIWLVAAPNIGGLLALFRSVQTRAETSATLLELSGLRVSALSAPVLQAGAQTRFAPDLDGVIIGLENMVQLVVGLRVLPEGVDRASVWALDDEEWFICASTSLTAAGQAFRQKRVHEATRGAGFVANFAAGIQPPESIPDQIVRGDVLLVGAGINDHPWFAPNPAERRRSEGIAVVRLRVGDKIAGALCLTSPGPAIPVTGSRAEEVIDILTRWAQAFGIALTSLHAIRSKRQQETSDEGHQADH
jgi:hypothetical protein